MPLSHQPIEPSAASASTPTLSVPNARAMDTTVTDAPTRFHADGVLLHMPQETTPVPLLLVAYSADPAAIPYLGVLTAKARTTPTQHNAPPTLRLLRMRTQKEKKRK